MLLCGYLGQVSYENKNTCQKAYENFKNRFFFFPHIRLPWFSDQPTSIVDIAKIV
jgi:hypothetical protein